MGVNLNKKFRANGVGLNVQFRSFLLDEEHFKDQIIKLASAFLKYFEFFTKFRRSQIMFVLKMFSDCGMFVFLNTLVQMAACVPNIICIAQITSKFINNTLLVN